MGLGLGTKGRNRGALVLEKWESRVGKRAVSRTEAVSWGDWRAGLQVLEAESRGDDELGRTRSVASTLQEAEK